LWWERGENTIKVIKFGERQLLKLKWRRQLILDWSEVDTVLVSWRFSELQTLHCTVIERFNTAEDSNVSFEYLYMIM
jgi:hypothetical protein